MSQSVQFSRPNHAMAPWETGTRVREPAHSSRASALNFHPHVNHSPSLIWLNAIMDAFSN